MKHKHKKILSLLLTLAMIFSLCSVPAYAETSVFAGGNGTAGDPYLISTADQLKAMSGKEAAYYLLINDLTLDAASGIALFTGTFDGGGHTISGIKSSLFTKVGAGDFVIKNITLDFNSTNQRGAVFGDISGTASVTMSNVHAIHRGNVKESGLVGEYSGPTTIENCSVIFESGANCTGTEYVGGLARRISDKYTIKDSFVYIKDGATLKVTAPPNDKRIICGVGGLAGTVAKPNISNTYVINQGKIASNVTVGSGGKPSTFTAGSGVYGGSWAGGNIKNSYAYQAGEVTYIDNTSATDRVGILAGNGQSAVSLENFVYFTNDDSIALNGDDTNANKANAGDMKNADTFTAWNLNTVDSAWVQNDTKSPAYNKIPDLEGVPYLKMEETAELATKYIEVNKKGDDDAVTMLKNVFSSYALTGVANVETPLAENTDYTFAGGKLKINNSYIKTLSTGTTALTLTFDKGIPVNFYIHVVEKPVVRIGTAENGLAVFADGTTKARDAVADAEVKVIAAPDPGYVLKGWKVGDAEQGDSAKDEWTYTLPGSITDDITITPVFEASTNHVEFTLKDESNASADMSGAVVTLTKDSDTITWTWNGGAKYHKALAEGTYQYKVEKDGYITETGSFDVSYSSGSPVPVALTIGKYYVGPYNDIEQKLTGADAGSGIYTVSYEINKVRAVSGQLTVTLPSGVKLMNETVEAAEGDVTAAVTAGTGVTVNAASLSSNALNITWAASAEGEGPHYINAYPDEAKTILSFKVKPTGKQIINATGNVADNNPNGADTDTKPLTVEVGVEDPDIVIVNNAFNAVNGATYADVAQATANDKTALNAYIKGIAEAALTTAGISDVTVTVTDGAFTPAVKGDADNVAGTNGSYSFTITVSKGVQTKTTGSKSIAITATAFTDADAVAAAKAAIINGSVDVAFGADQTAKTLAVQTYVNGKLTGNAAGVTAVVTLKSGNTYTVALSKGSASDSKEITMTINEAADPDIATVDNAFNAVNGATYADAAQATANDKTALNAYIKGIAEAALTTAGISDVTVTVTDGAFTPAVKGDADNVTGTNGSYSFTITVSKGVQTKTTGSKSIAITATAFTDADAVAAAKAAIINGSVDVAFGADQTAKTLAVQTYVNSKLTGDAAGVTAVVTFKSGNTYTVALTKGSANDSKEINMTINEAASTYTVSFNANGGTVIESSAVTGADGRLSSLPTPTRSGYIFNGWYTSASGGEQVTVTTVFTGDTTIYAQWTANSTSGGGGGSYIPPVQKPVIDNNNNAKTELSGDGTKLTIKAEEGYKLVDVIVNGVSKGAVDTLTGLKTGDKVVVVTEEIETEPTIEEVKAELGTSSLVARSQAVTLKNGKKAIKITWYDQNGNEVKYDGVEIYRSTKRNTGYGKKPIYVSKSGVYYNTSIKLGTKYYYRVRGFREIDGQKYYTNWSLKAFRAW